LSVVSCQLSVVSCILYIMRLFNQSLTITLALLFVLIIISTPLSTYMTQILGFVILVSVIFIIIKKRQKKDEELFMGSNPEVFVIITSLLLAVFLTGGSNSGLFFLLYFLLFGIVFLYEPATVFVLLLGLILVFSQSLSEGDLLLNLIKLGSLALLSPVSFFFGREFAKREMLEKKIKDKTGQIIEDAQTLREQTNNEEVIDEIDDIAEKAEELREEAEKE